MSTLERDISFGALTRPQMFAGVTHSFFVANVVLATELFLIFRSVCVMIAAAVIHGAGVLLCLREPRFFDLWLGRVSNCPRVRYFRVWGCNSYRA
jgi:type IV secretion system protein VirB3